MGGTTGRSGRRVKLTVAVHPVEGGVEAEVGRVVLTPVVVQVTGQALHVGVAASDRYPGQQTSQ